VCGCVVCGGLVGVSCWEEEEEEEEGRETWRGGVPGGRREGLASKQTPPHRTHSPCTTTPRHCRVCGWDGGVGVERVGGKCGVVCLAKTRTRRQA